MNEAVSSITVMRDLQFDWYEVTFPDITSEMTPEFLKAHWDESPFCVVTGEVFSDLDPRPYRGPTKSVSSNYPMAEGLLDAHGRQLASAHWGGAPSSRADGKGGNDKLHIISSGHMSPFIARWIRSLPVVHEVSRVDVAIDYHGPHTQYARTDLLEGSLKPKDEKPEPVNDLSFLPMITEGYGPIIGDDTGVFELCAREVVNMIQNWKSFAFGGVPPATQAWACDPLSYFRGQGRTLYVGTGGAGGARFRIYEKGVEQLEKSKDLTQVTGPNGQPLEHPRDWVRVELEWRPKGTQRLEASKMSEAEIFSGARKFAGYLAERFGQANLGLISRPIIWPKTPEESLRQFLRQHGRMFVEGSALMSLPDLHKIMVEEIPDLGNVVERVQVNQALRVIEESEPRIEIDKAVIKLATYLRDELHNVNHFDRAAIFQLTGLPFVPLTMSVNDIAEALMLRVVRNTWAIRPAGVSYVVELMDNYRRAFDALDRFNVPMAAVIKAQNSPVATLALQSAARGREDKDGAEQTPRRLQ